MLEGILGLFTTEQNVQAMLAHPMIRVIFMTLFLSFTMTFIVHLALFYKLKRLRNYLKETNRMDIEPLQSIKQQFDQRQADETVTVETYVQERFSNWRFVNVPVVSLIKFIQMTVSLFILLGVLGTFIGLTISLGSINAGGDQLVENVAAVLSGIDVAFYTSIVGMGCSLIMTILTKALNTEYMLTDLMLTVESNLEGQEQKGLGRLVDVSESIQSSIVDLHQTNEKSLQQVVESFTGFKDYTSGLQQSAQDLAAFNDGLSANLEDFHELFQQMKVVTNGFSEGTNALNKNFHSLFAYFKTSDRRHERMAEVFESTYDHMKKLAAGQLETFQQFQDSAEGLRQFTESLLAEHQGMQTTFKSVHEHIHRLVDQMGEHNEEFKRLFGNDLSARLEVIGTYLQELSGDFDRLGGSISGLPQALDIIQQTQTEHKDLLSDRFHELKEFNQTFSQHIRDHKIESIAFEKHMRHAASTFEQVGRENNQLINDMKGTISHLSQAFHERDNQLDANVNVLRETLSQYANNLEGTLGDKLDHVARQMSQSMTATSDNVTREFADMRRLTEDMQHQHARAQQQVLQTLSDEIQSFSRNLNTIGQNVPNVSRPSRVRYHE